MPFISASICASMPCFYIKLKTSFIYKDIFTKFAGNVYGHKNMPVQNFGLILKNKMAVKADCLKNIKML